MFIKTIVKTDKKTGKRYDYYRLSEGYRIDGKVRHRSILTLGMLEGIESKEDRKLLADRIEALVKGESQLFPISLKSEIEQYAQEFSQRIIQENLLDVSPNKGKDLSEKETDYQVIDINSLEHEDVRELGAEWLCFQALQELQWHDLADTLDFSEEEANYAMMQLVSRACFPFSEHKTEQWIKENSSVSELCNVAIQKVSRHKLYRMSKQLYAHKTQIEKHLSTQTNDLFDLEDKIIFYDLTNTYFEGRKQGSELAKHGRSKEKRKDAKLVSLAVVVNAEGFIKYSKIYKGNISEVTTLEKTIEELSVNTSLTDRKPVIVMDAGIASEQNLEMLKTKGYDYLCVSRTSLKDYKSKLSEGQTVETQDNKQNTIVLKNMKKDDCQDTYLYVRSEQKAKKEASMKESFSLRYEDDLEQIRQALFKKGGTKKIDKVWVRIGRLKERYTRANKHYSITVIADDDNKNAIDIKWVKKETTPNSEDGVYFIRTSLQEKEEKILWTIYNTLTEVEATFRVLKTDLSIRPVYHKTDENIEAHLFLGIVAYQIVAMIRYQLKQKGIKSDWSDIVRIMNTQKLVTSQMKTETGSLIRIKKSSLPREKVKQIYDALHYKYQPYQMKKSVVPE